MAEEVLACDGNKVGCLLSAVVGNSWCDMKVVGRGFKDWLQGRQKAPWSNYIFIPRQAEDEDFSAADRAEYFKTNPDIQSEMQQLQKLNEELEHEENQQQQVSPEQQPE